MPVRLPLRRNAPWFSLRPWEAATLASAALVLLPFTRTVWTWPWLWIVPGHFFATRVLAVSTRTFPGFALIVLWSVALVPLVCLPSIVAFGRPAPGAIVASVAAFSLLCAAPPRCRKNDGGVRVPAPPFLVWAMLGGFAVIRLIHIRVTFDAPPDTFDGTYFHGMVGALGRSFPPLNPVQATSVLKQPWACWLFYSICHLLSGLPIGPTLQLASLALAIAFGIALYALAVVVTGDRRAGSLAVLVAFSSAELTWIEGSVNFAGFGRWFGAALRSFPENLEGAFYNVPVLLVMVGVLLLLGMEATADAANAAESRRYFVGAWIGLAVLPFFHPAYAIVFGASLAIAMAFQRARGTLPRHHLAVVLTPVPFVVLYVGIYAHMAHPRVPFAVTMAGAPARALSLLRWGGLWCPAALFGAMRGRFALRPHLLSLAATTAMMAIFTTNAANNLAWTYNPFAVACALLAGCGLSALIAAAPRAGALLASVQLGLGYVGARYDVDLLEDARGKRRGPPGRDEIELASWIRSHVTDDQGIAVEPRSLPALRAVVATASHPVWLGPAYLLQLTEDPGTLDTLIAQNDRVLHAPCDAEVDRARVRYVVADREASSATIAAWKPFDAAVFENGAFVVYDTRRRGTCPP